jgi:hypothetical protein
MSVRACLMLGIVVCTGGSKWHPNLSVYNAFLLALSHCIGRPHQRPSASATESSSSSLNAPLSSSSTAVAWHDIDESIRDVRRLVCEMVDVGAVPSLHTLIGTACTAALLLMFDQAACVLAIDATVPVVAAVVVAVTVPDVRLHSLSCMCLSEN